MVHHLSTCSYHCGTSLLHFSIADWLAIHGPPVACLEENHQFGYTWATIPPVAYREENHQFGYAWATSGLSRGKSPICLSMGHQWSIYRKISLSIHGPPVACLEENHQFGYTWATSGLSTGKSVWLSMGHQWSI